MNSGEIRMDTCPLVRERVGENLQDVEVIHVLYLSIFCSAIHYFQLPLSRLCLSAFYTSASLVVAFNSGLRRPLTMDPTVKLLMRKNFPVVFTSYNRGEAKR